MFCAELDVDQTLDDVDEYLDRVQSRASTIVLQNLPHFLRDGWQGFSDVLPHLQKQSQWEFAEVIGWFRAAKSSVSTVRFLLSEHQSSLADAHGYERLCGRLVQVELRLDRLSRFFGRKGDE